MIEQGTQAWKYGWIGASRMADVMAKGKSGAPSATRANLMAEKIVERLTGKRVETYQSAEMTYGIETEPMAAIAYEFLNDVELQTCSFIPHPTIDFTGATPDRLHPAGGLVEFKCPNSKTHIDTLLNDTIDRRYILQMQWQMCVTQRDWCDFVSFDNRLPPSMQLYQRRIFRDDRLIAEMTIAIREFIEELNEKTIALQEKFSPLQRDAA